MWRYGFSTASRSKVIELAEKGGLLLVGYRNASKKYEKENADHCEKENADHCEKGYKRLYESGLSAKVNVAQCA